MPSQEEKLQLFQEVTHAADRASAIQALSSCGWNVEQAVQLFMASADEETGLRAPPHETQPVAPPAASAAAPDRGLGAPLLGGGGGLRDTATPPHRRGTGGVAAEGHESSCCCSFLTGRGPPNSSSNVQAQSGVLGWLTRGIRRISDSLSCLVRVFMFGARGAGTGLGLGGPISGESLRQSLMMTYGPGVELPAFADGSFTDVLRRARQELKLVVVYLHSPISPQAQSFCTGILGNEFVRTMIDGSFVCWAGDVTRGETQAVAMMVHALETPCLAVVLPASVDDLRVLGTLTGDAQSDGAVALLTHCLDEMDSHRAELVARNEQHNEDRMLREQQDREYQEALEADRLRVEEQKKQVLARAEEERLAREKELDEQHEADRLEAEHLAKIEDRKRRAAALAPETDEATARVSLRLPAGQRVQRRFAPSATLAEVYAWAELLPWLPDNLDKGFAVPERFTLKTSFPTRDLVEREKTVGELQLAGNNLVMAEDDDESPL